MRPLSLCSKLAEAGAHFSNFRTQLILLSVKIERKWLLHLGFRWKEIDFFL